MPMERMKKSSLSEQVASRIKSSILDETYRVGERIPTEPALMELFGVSRSTVREAVRTLINEGILETQQGSGTYVKQKESKNESLENRLKRSAADQVYEVRQIIELEIARLAARRRTEQDLRAMETHLLNRRIAGDKGDRAGYVQHDVLFHTALAAATKNQVLEGLYQDFSRGLEDVLDIVTPEWQIESDQGDCHFKILDAVREQDEAAAIYWTGKNLASIEEALNKTEK
ncbi:MAG: FadR family transcriptional regulator [Clostridia bacterium]|nr:FadR family transcriptional regulator [Clostridia bacterium]